MFAFPKSSVNCFFSGKSAHFQTDGRAEHLHGFHVKGTIDGFWARKRNWEKLFSLPVWDQPPKYFTARQHAIADSGALAPFQYRLLEGFPSLRDLTSSFISCWVHAASTEPLVHHMSNDWWTKLFWGFSWNECQKFKKLISRNL